MRSWLSPLSDTHTFRSSSVQPRKLHQELGVGTYAVRIRRVRKLPAWRLSTRGGQQRPPFCRDRQAHDFLGIHGASGGGANFRLDRELPPRRFRMRRHDTERKGSNVPTRSRRSHTEGRTLARLPFGATQLIKSWAHLGVVSYKISILRGRPWLGKHRVKRKDARTWELEPRIPTK